MVRGAGPEPDRPPVPDQRAAVRRGAAHPRRRGARLLAGTAPGRRGGARRHRGAPGAARHAGRPLARGLAVDRGPRGGPRSRGDPRRAQGGAGRPGGLGRGPGARGGCPGPVSSARRRSPRGPLPAGAGSGVRPLRPRARPGAGRPHRPGGPRRLQGLRLHAPAGRLASVARADRRAVGRGRGPRAHPERVLGELAAGLGAGGLLRPGARGPGTAGRSGGGMGPEVGTPWAGVPGLCLPLNR